MYHNKILSLYQLRMDQYPDSRPDPWFSNACIGLDLDPVKHSYPYSFKNKKKLFLEFIAQKDAFLRPFPPFFM